MTPYGRVLLSRTRTNATFLLPSVLDYIRRAIVCLAEYDNAILEGDAAAARDGCGQALYMLLNAAVQLQYEPSCDDEYWKFNGHGHAYYVALVTTANAMDSMMRKLYAIGDVNDAYTAFVALAGYHGWDVDALIDDTCAAFEAQHAPTREVH